MTGVKEREERDKKTVFAEEYKDFAILKKRLEARGNAAKGH